MVDEKYAAVVTATSEDWAHAKCDKYDYLIAVFCGSVAGFVDAMFVGSPLDTKLGGKVDNAVDNTVIKIAQTFWKVDPRSRGKSRKMPGDLNKSISYLEQAFPVNYDGRYGKDFENEELLGGVYSGNHHLKSLAHSPDIIGLAFSILDQFTGKASFVNDGKIIRVVPTKVSRAIPYMQGSNFITKLFCGFLNWFGHLVSDVSGSSSTRQKGKTGRGTGLSIPFFELFQFCDFGNIQGDTIAKLMEEVYSKGYDFRFGITMAIPVVLNELMIRAIWVLRQALIRKQPMRACLPTKEHADLRIMLLVGNATLCTIDGIDAARHGFMTGNVVDGLIYVNYMAWVRLTMLIVKELCIRFGPVVKRTLDQLVKEILAGLGLESEKQLICNFYSRMEMYDKHLEELYNAFVEEIKAEYLKAHEYLEVLNDPNVSGEEKLKTSADAAKYDGVSREKVISTLEEANREFG